MLDLTEPSSQAFSFRPLDLARNVMTSFSGYAIQWRHISRKVAWVLGWIFTKVPYLIE